MFGLYRSQTDAKAAAEKGVAGSKCLTTFTTDKNGKFDTSTYKQFSATDPKYYLAEISAPPMCVRSSKVVTLDPSECASSSQVITKYESDFEETTIKGFHIKNSGKEWRKMCRRSDFSRSDVSILFEYSLYESCYIPKIG